MEANSLAERVCLVLGELCFIGRFVSQERRRMLVIFYLAKSVIRICLNRNVALGAQPNEFRKQMDTLCVKPTLN